MSLYNIGNTKIILQYWNIMLNCGSSCCRQLVTTGSSGSERPRLSNNVVGRRLLCAGRGGVTLTSFTAIKTTLKSIDWWSTYRQRVRVGGFITVDVLFYD